MRAIILVYKDESGLFARFKFKGGNRSRLPKIPLKPVFAVGETAEESRRKNNLPHLIRIAREKCRKHGLDPDKVAGLALSHRPSP